MTSIKRFITMFVFVYAVVQFSAGLLYGTPLEAMAYHTGVVIVAGLALRGNDDNSG